jgi:hypothetical protein
MYQVDSLTVPHETLERCNSVNDNIYIGQTYDSEGHDTMRVKGSLAFVLTAYKKLRLKELFL